ncbi:hypothetical protein V5799_000610 [Amblyomma americanum]|uniref:Uncharacterized protein n=1 Tax=Amblyomma americanum TaxID=6943 RepID=A0AAQ4D2J6_AMBAM
MLPKIVASKAVVSTLALGVTAGNKLETIATKTHGKAFNISDLRGNVPLQLKTAFFSSTTHAQTTAPTLTLLDAEEEFTSSLEKFQMDSAVGYSTVVHVKQKSPRNMRIQASLIDPSGQPCQGSHESANGDKTAIAIPSPAMVGTWTLHMTSPTSTPVKVSVRVESEPRTKDEQMLEVSCRVSHQHVNKFDESVILAKIKKGKKVVLDAVVLATVHRPEKNPQAITIALHDDGLDPDVQENDGVYCEYFVDFIGKGIYPIKVEVSNQNSTRLDYPFSGSDSFITTSMLQDTMVDTCLQDYLTTDAGDFISWRNDYLLQAPPPFHVTCPDLRLKDRQPGFNFSGHSGPHIGMLPYASWFCFAQVFLLGPSKLLLHQDTATVDTCLQDYLTTDAGDFISWRNDYLLQAPPPFHVTCPDLRLKYRQPGFNFSGHSGPHLGMLPYASWFCFAQVFLLGPSKLLLHQDTATVDTCLQDYLTTAAGDFISWRNDYLLQAPPPFHVTCPDLRLKYRQPGFNFSGHSGPHLGMLPYASLFCFAQVFLLGPSKLLLHQDTATVDTCLQDYLTTAAGDFISWRNDYLLQAPPPFHVTCPDLRLKDRQPGFNFSGHSGPHLGMLPYASWFCFAQVFLLGPSKLLLHQDTATVDTCLQDYLTTAAGDFISWRNDYLLQAPPPFHVTCPDLRLKDRQPGFNFSGHSGPHIGMLPYASLFCFAQYEYPLEMLEIVDEFPEDKSTTAETMEDFQRAASCGHLNVTKDITIKQVPPGKILDFAVKDVRPGKRNSCLVQLTWTWPGAHIKSGKASALEIRVANNSWDLIYDFENQVEITEANVAEGNLDPKPPGGQHNVTLSLPPTFSSLRQDGEFNCQVYVGARVVNTDGLKSTTSRVVPVFYYPRPVTTTVAATTKATTTRAPTSKVTTTQAEGAAKESIQGSDLVASPFFWVAVCCIAAAIVIVIAVAVSAILNREEVEES